MEANNIVLSKENEKISKKAKSSIPIQEEILENNTNIEQSDIVNNTFPQNQNIFQEYPAQNSKSVKFDINNITEIPLKGSYNLRYSDTINYDNLKDNVKDIIFDPKYKDEKRSKSAYSKKSFREKFESMKLKVPEIKKWNCDPTAEIIIHNLEQKIDILTYENFLLTRKIKELITHNKELQLNISQNILLIKTEEQLNNDNYKINENKINNKNKKKAGSDKNKEKEKEKGKGKDIDLSKQINNLKDENNKLKRSNENLAENNMELNKIINELKKELQLNQIKYEEDMENNRIFFEKKIAEQNEIIEELNNNNIHNNIINDNINNDEKMKDYNNIKCSISFNNNENNDAQNISASFDMNKYLINEEQYRQLLEENERLHKRLRNLLSIEDGDINKSSISFQENNNIDNINNNQNLINNTNISNNDLIVENKLLKQKIKSLNMELNKVTLENNQYILKLQEKINQKESKNIENVKKVDNINNNIDNKKEEEKELDKLLNEILLININPDDEESQKMISTLQNIKNNDKKRISQCLIINNKLKSLSEENNLLHNQLLSLQKGNKDNNLNLNMNMNSTDHNCFCKSQNNESYDYLINALKIKDEIIIKYKEKNDDNENKYKQLMIENSKLRENNKNRNRINDYNFIPKNIKMNSLRTERAEGLEDYLLDKIVNNQKEVLGERAPRFEENNNFMSKSLYEKNERMNKKYKNYHYRERSTNDYE